MYLSSGENFAGCTEIVSTSHLPHFSFSVYRLHLEHFLNRNLILVFPSLL